MRRWPSRPGGRLWSRPGRRPRARRGRGGCTTDKNKKRETMEKEKLEKEKQ